MKKFLVVYYAPREAWGKMADATEEEKQAGMKPWMDWKESMGANMIDFGAPLMPGQRFKASGLPGMANPELTGYSIIQAADKEAAKNAVKDHPHLKWTPECSLEVYEFAKM